MTAYHYSSNVHKKLKRRRKIHNTLLVPLVALSFLLVGGGVYIWQQISQEQPNPETKQVSLGYYTGVPKKPYNNEVFSFLSTTDWLFIRESSAPPTRYVYYSHANGITEYELTITVNNPNPYKKAVHYIVPITVQSGALVPGMSSNRCDTREVGGRDVVRQYQGVTYYCDIDSSGEIYAAGIAGGSYEIPLYDGKGRLQKTSFFMVDHTSGQSPEIFKEVLASFKLK